MCIHAYTAQKYTHAQIHTDPHPNAQTHAGAHTDIHPCSSTASLGLSDLGAFYRHSRLNIRKWGK